MKKVSIKDLMEFSFISGLCKSPGGDVGFVVQKANDTGDGYSGHIYLYNKSDKSIKRLTGHGDEKSLVFLDDKTIMFPSNSRDSKLAEKIKNGEMWTAFYTLDLTGGEAREYMRIPMKVTDITPLGEDKFVFSAVYDPGYPDASELSKHELAEALKKVGDEKNYDVFEEIPFWGNGTGVTSGRRSRLYIYDKETARTTAVTGEKEQLNYYSVKGDKVVFAATLFENKIGQANGLYLYNVKTGERETLIEQNEISISAAEFVGDTLMVAASDMKTYGLNEIHNFYVYENGSLRLIYANDDSVGNSLATDVKLGKYRSVRSDDKYFYFTLTRGFSSYIARIDISGKLEVFGEQGEVCDFVAIDSGFAAIAQRGDKLQELYYIAEDSGEKQVSDFNEEYFKTHSVGTPEHFIYKSGAAELDGWVLTPPDFNPNDKYPAVLDIHGGPKAAYSSVFMHEMQVWAAAGYIVFFTNPRGGAGKGDAFADIRGKYGTIDFDDLMTFTDEVLRRYPSIDTGRVGVTGGSYGGFMTNWIVGHTDRFKAAATQRSISNWISFYGTTDIGYYFGQDQIAANPWDDAEKMWWHSPLKYAPNFKTPTLIIHSDQDLRCWWVEGLQMFTALKMHGVESRMWLCHGENHELSRGGKPKNRIRRLEEITGWFDKYLLK